MTKDRPTAIKSVERAIVEPGYFDLLGTVGADEVMSGIFSEDRSVGDWLSVEAAFTSGLSAVGIIDSERAERIIEACIPSVIDRERLWAETRVVGYPILPLVRMICAALNDDDAGFVHYGATTQDIMDSALAMQLRDAASRLVDQVVSVGDALAALAERHAGTVMAGRTHAQQAVPTTFGAKCGTFLSEYTRHLQRLVEAGEDVAVISVFGAGGTSAALGVHGPAVRAKAAAVLGLRDTEIPWHVTRDRITHLTAVCAQIAATSIRLARELIDLARTEVGEVAEADGLYRGASSTMPQKANPISAELTIGFGVMAQAGSTAMLRAMEAGHERAAGEWQIEWQALPLTFMATAGALRAVLDQVTGLRVFPERMLTNLNLDGGRIMAEAYMIALSAHLGRDRAHEFIYRAVRDSRAANEPLQSTLRKTVGPEIWAAIGERLPNPEDYVGVAPYVSVAAIHAWQTVRPSHIPEGATA